MTHENYPESQSAHDDAPTEDNGTHARVKRLQEKVGGLAETLESVEKTLSEAAGESER